MEDLVKQGKVIESDGGQVIKFAESTLLERVECGEVYFSKVIGGADRGWKIHAEANARVIVPIGRVVFAVANLSFSSSSVIELSEETGNVLTIPAGYWYRFKGLMYPISLIGCLLDIPHQVEACLPEQIELNRRRPNIDVIWSEKRVDTA